MVTALATSTGHDPDVFRSAAPLDCEFHPFALTFAEDLVRLTQLTFPFCRLFDYCLSKGSQHERFGAGTKTAPWIAAFPPGSLRRTKCSGVVASSGHPGNCHTEQMNQARVGRLKAFLDVGSFVPSC